MTVTKYSSLLLVLTLGNSSLVAACSDDTADASGAAGASQAGGTGKAGAAGKAGATGTAGESSSDEGGSGGAAGSQEGGTGGVDDEPFTPPSDPGKGGFLVTVSGEDLANVGYDFSASSLADGDPPAFVDGWALTFEHVIVTVANVHVNADPDKDEGNPQDLGKLVASADGPWAVDATIGGGVIGKSESPDERTIPIVAFAKQSDGSAFDPESRYAFSYDLVPASTNARLTNLDAAGKALYAEAKEKGWSMIYAGTATYKGPTPEDGSVFAKIPTTVKFTLGLKNPSSYINCRNTDLTHVV
jgi:hypothetical protein